MEQITQKQQEILEFVHDYIHKQGYPPSVREICAGVGLRSPSSVHSHLKKLEQVGYIQRDGKKTRALNLSYPGGTSSNTRNIPILGHVAAGSPILALEDIEGYVPYNDTSSGYEYFALRVKGDSMINAGILQNDIIIVRKQQTAMNGEIVVALIDDEATVKRLHLSSGMVWLMPENADYSPINGTDAEILGKVVATIRYYY